MKKTKKIRALDLFCGAGGSSHGARRAGVEVVAGVDMWDVAAETYRRNFPDAEIYQGNIRDLSPVSIQRKVGKIDLILASPECTSHSCAKGAAPRCEDSRMTAFQVTRFAKAFKPRWIVIENVPHMQSWARYGDLLSQLRGLGYFVGETKLNAKDYGVPQSRRRLFIMCSLDGEVEGPPPSTIRHEPASSIIDRSARYPMTALFNSARAEATLERAERAIKELGSKEPFLLVYYGSDKAGGWQPLDKPLRTVTTLDRFAYVRPTSKGHMMRMLQPEELKLAMGFPKGYRLAAASKRDAIKLLGNAVCPPVMERVVRTLVRQGA